ncbi:MAG: FtsX-like permease family protein, partial [bacterium]|nr:FtsX-like permease family protein [bacterium]
MEKNPEGVTAIAGFRRLGANLSFEHQTVDGEIAVVSGAYFPTLGVNPALGRPITPDDDVHGAGNAVAVLGYGYWQDRLGGRPEVLNKPIRINDHLFTVVGIAPRGFTGITFGNDPDVYVPICFKSRLTPGWDGTDLTDDYWVYLFARLLPGGTTQQAEASLNSVYAGLIAEHAKTIRRQDEPYNSRLKASRLSLREGRHGQSYLRDNSHTPRLILTGATGLVLLIAMANAANLMLARSAQRRKELAIRTALGAGRGEIMRQMLTEAVLLSGGGGVAGIVLASWTLNLLLAEMADGDPIYYMTTGLQWPVLLFCLAISLLTGLLFGLHPAWVAARQTVAGILKDDSGTASSSRGSIRARRL